jgi:hypothetical protein
MTGDMDLAVVHQGLYRHSYIYRKVLGVCFGSVRRTQDDKTLTRRENHVPGYVGISYLLWTSPSACDVWQFRSTTPRCHQSASLAASFPL